MSDDFSDERILRGLLDSIDSQADVSQRKLADELGIALGLTNAYIRRCIRKGLIKVSEAPARRYRYYLTPQGFAEKARLTAEYITSSLAFFRQARQAYEGLFARLAAAGRRRVILVGRDDLAEIAVLCAGAAHVQVAGVLAPGADSGRFHGAPVIGPGALSPDDCCVLATITDTQAAYDEAVRLVGAERVVVPEFLTRLINTRLHEARSDDTQTLS